MKKFVVPCLYVYKYFHQMLARETVRLLESGHKSVEMTIESKEESCPLTTTLETIKMDISSI